MKVTGRAGRLCAPPNTSNHTFGQPSCDAKLLRLRDAKGLTCCLVAEQLEYQQAMRTLELSVVDGQGEPVPARVAIVAILGSAVLFGGLMYYQLVYAGFDAHIGQRIGALFQLAHPFHDLEKTPS